MPMPVLFRLPRSSSPPRPTRCRPTNWRRRYRRSGGLDRIHAISSLELEDRLYLGGQFGPGFANCQKTPQSVRIEATIQGMTQIRTRDGKGAWQISPFQSRRDPEKMSADDARSLADDTAIAGPLVDCRANGSTLACHGTEDVDGTQVHQLDEITVPASMPEQDGGSGGGQEIVEALMRGLDRD